MRTTWLITAAAVALLAPRPVRADFLALPWRGGANTTYQEWTAFTSATGPNAPNAVGGSNPPGTTPDVRNGEPTAFLTGGGNIYSFAAPLDIDVTVPDFDLGSGWSTTILLQVRTLGTEIDPASVTLTALGGSPVAFGSSEELARVPLGGFGGFQVDTLYRWEVAGNASSYLLSFLAAGSSMSLDQLSVDTLSTLGGTGNTSVPEPASMASASVGLLLAASWWGLRRRRRVAAGLVA